MSELNEQQGAQGESTYWERQDQERERNARTVQISLHKAYQQI